MRADELAARFGVSVETIRRDLVALEREGLTRRVYGGAMRTAQRRSEAPFEMRRVAHASQKWAMARLAASLIEPDDLLILDVGTSVAEIAAQLRADYRGLVLTNSLLVAVQLADRSGLQLLTSGGRVRRGDLACFGPQAEAFFAGYFGGKAFLGSGGVHPESGVTDFYPDEIPMRRAILTNASERYVMADSSKLGEVATARVCALEAITAVITDDGVDDATRRAFEAVGAQLLIATTTDDEYPDDEFADANG